MKKVIILLILMIGMVSCQHNYAVEGAAIGGVIGSIITKKPQGKTHRHVHPKPRQGHYCGHCRTYRTYRCYH